MSKGGRRDQPVDSALCPTAYRRGRMKKDTKEDDMVVETDEVRVDVM